MPSAIPLCRYSPLRICSSHGKTRGDLSGVSFINAQRTVTVILRLLTSSRKMLSAIVLVPHHQIFLTAFAPIRSQTLLLCCVDGQYPFDITVSKHLPTFIHYIISLAVPSRATRVSFFSTASIQFCARDIQRRQKRTTFVPAAMPINPCSASFSTAGRASSVNSTPNHQPRPNPYFATDRAFCRQCLHLPMKY